MPSSGWDSVTHRLTVVTETAVLLGLLQLFMPLMIISDLSRQTYQMMPLRLPDFGANWLQVFLKVILPLTKEGLVIGGTLVFTVLSPLTLPLRSLGEQRS